MHLEDASNRKLLLVKGSSSVVALHLLPTPRSTAEVPSAEASAVMTDAFILRNSERTKTQKSRPVLVHLWEDQWLEHDGIVQSRILAMLGRARRIFARTTRVHRIDKAACDAFLLENHLWGATKARYRYGLYANKGEGDLVAVASFSPRWNLRRYGHENPRASHELIRYCSRRGTTVVGGISKLLSAFIADADPDEIVTVIDRDWGSGEGWQTLGFRPLKKLPPVTFYVGPDGLRCHPGEGPNPHRRRLPPDVAAALQAASSATAEKAGSSNFDHETLATLDFFPVRDAGAERHLLVVTPVPAHDIDPVISTTT